MSAIAKFRSAIGITSKKISLNLILISRSDFKFYRLTNYFLFHYSQSSNEESRQARRPQESPRQEGPQEGCQEGRPQEGCQEGRRQESRQGQGQEEVINSS